VWPVAQCDAEHFLGRRDLQIERQVDVVDQARDVIVGDVAPVLAQMRGDAVGTGRRRLARRAHRIGVATAAGVPDGRYVVDVHAETQIILIHASS
jgi:hypothetical protein